MIYMTPETREFCRRLKESREETEKLIRQYKESNYDLEKEDPVLSAAVTILGRYIGRLAAEGITKERTLTVKDSLER